MIWEFRKMKSSLGTIYAASRLISRGVYNVSGPFHPFGGAVDMIVVQQPCGSFKSSPWYVRFGKFQGILKARKKVVSINVNGVEADFHMFLDNKGEAYFLNDVVGEEKKEEEGSLSSSRPSSLSEESKSCNLDGTQKNSSAQNDKGEGKIVARKKSRRFSGLLFWRKLMKKGIGSEMYVSPRTIVASGGSWRPWFLKRLKTMGAVHPVFDGIRGSNADNASEKRSYLWPYKNVHKIKVNRKKEMSIVPSSEHLASLNLKEGRNIIKFTFSTAMLGKQQVDARVYLMKWNTRIVVTDVDGTITKSDVLGQFMPLIGKDWSQTGVAHLFSAIEENGYKFLYLSARPVSQAYLTRQFLINLKQDGKALPDGPVVISADGLLFSLYREVVRRAPHEFKIPCLEDIKALFPPDCNPFYAGFGNRATDELSYLKVGIPKGKIFTINPKGEVACLLSPLHGEVAADRMIDMKSYTSLHADVNATFPATFSDGQQLICGGFNGEERHHILASLQITFGLGAVSRNAEGKISGSCCSLCFSR